jgi:hypothetical protein
MIHRTRLAILSTLAAAAVAGGTVLRLRAQSPSCAWCSTTELSVYEYCDAGWAYKHAFLAVQGDYGGPAHNQFYCGLCSMEHDICSEDFRYAKEDLQRAVSPGGDLRGALRRHARFAELDADRNRVILHDCDGDIEETLVLTRQQTRAATE